MTQIPTLVEVTQLLAETVSKSQKPVQLLHHIYGTCGGTPQLQQSRSTVNCKEQLNSSTTTTSCNFLQSHQSGIDPGSQGSNLTVLQLLWTKTTSWLSLLPPLFSQFVVTACIILVILILYFLKPWLCCKDSKNWAMSLMKSENYSNIIRKMKALHYPL